MQLFCPSCSNLLIVTKCNSSVSEEDQGKNRLECRTCPFQFILNKRYFDRKELKAKQIEDIVGGARAADSAQTAPAQCVNEKCDSKMAFWYSVQIRSADEPSTNFYKCIKCAREWRE